MGYEQHATLGHVGWWRNGCSEHSNSYEGGCVDAFIGVVIGVLIVIAIGSAILGPHIFWSIVIYAAAFFVYMVYIAVVEPYGNDLERISPNVPGKLVALSCCLGTATFFSLIIDPFVGIGSGVLVGSAVFGWYYLLMEHGRDKQKRIDEYTTCVDVRNLLPLFEVQLSSALHARGVTIPLDGICAELSRVIGDIISDTFSVRMRESYFRFHLKLINLTPVAYQNLVLSELFDVVAGVLSMVPTGMLGLSAPAQFTLDLCEVCGANRNPVAALLNAIERIDAKSFPRTLDTYTVSVNRKRASLQRYSEHAVAEGKLLAPEDYRGSISEAAGAYFDGTPYLALLHLSLPWAVHGDVRFEHQFVVAPPGSGKTTLLQTQIIGDFDKVATGEASIVVIDGENELIPDLAHLKIFAPGGKLHGRLVVLEPEADYPIALSVFDTTKLSGTTEEKIEAQKDAIENVSSCLATMNDAQDDMLSYLVELCLVIPDATIRTLMELLEPDGLKKYGQHLAKLDEIARGYFTTTFIQENRRPTKDAVLSRLQGMLRNVVFRRMFENTSSAFDMAREIEAGKVILINTKRKLMGANGCQMLGRYFLSQLMQAAVYRGSSSKAVYCYVDECQDYISQDERIAAFLDKARKRRVGMIFATQKLGNIESPRVRGTLSELAIIFTATNDQTERGRFQCHVRRMTKKDEPLDVQVPPGVLQRMERMRDSLYEDMKAAMRKRYSRTAEAVAFDPDTEMGKQGGVVVPLWGRLERTAIAAGATNEGGGLDINKLAGRLTADQIETFHILRRTRNRLIHEFTPIEDIGWWETQARALHAVLMKMPPPPDDDSSRSSPTF